MVWSSKFNPYTSSFSTKNCNIPSVGKSGIGVDIFSKLICASKRKGIPSSVVGYGISFNQ